MKLDILLDSSPLSNLTRPSDHSLQRPLARWCAKHLEAGNRLFIPGIIDYELRRELLRSRMARAFDALEAAPQGLGLIALPISQAVIDRAAILWATSRQAGRPTADPLALDIDAILGAAAQLHAEAHPDRRVIVATSNVRHLSQFCDAQEWQSVAP